MDNHLLFASGGPTLRPLSTGTLFFLGPERLLRLNASLKQGFRPQVVDNFVDMGIESG